MLMVLKKIPRRTIYNFVYERRVVLHLSSSQSQLKETQVEEVKIPVPWGHIAGKRWGIKNLKPVLCVHGWQDNACTFDSLIPLLPPEYCYVAIDLPGHGLSSHIPQGLFYTPIEYISIIRRAQFYFNWSSFAYMGHSFGGACGMVFASCFPKDVNFFIAIDNIKPISAIASEYINKMPDLIEKMLTCDTRTARTAPFYTKEELVKRWIEGSKNSLNEKSVGILMKRGVEVQNGKYRLTRDCRVKIGSTSHLMQKDILDMARKITCSVLFIKSSDGPYFEKKEYVVEIVNTIKGNAKYFEQHDLPGTHHIHLNSPEVVAPVITKFIKNIEAKGLTKTDP